ncbi:SAC domain [Dillenia turbinata]|uniref:SAC domain n=1 Tax=Dillenia turbinata TaxID=194707 RepID=A0AAN8Z4K5_9MAGN
MEKAESLQKLYTRMRLWEFPDQYVVEPTDGSAGSSLSISKADGALNLIDGVPHCSSVRVPKIRTIFGIIGMLKLVAGSYLVVIAERECVGSYLGHPIYRVSSLKIFPCDRSLNNSPAEHKKMENEFSVLLNAAERMAGLFFSYDTNLTLSAQRLHDLGDESKLLPLWRQVSSSTAIDPYDDDDVPQADPRYLWNNYMMEVLIDNKLDPFLVPVIQGNILIFLLIVCFHNFQAAIEKDIVDVTLIARRCTRRIGTRMWRRGADSDGYVANFVESEQIIQMNGFTASFVQVRGSIPLLWEQIVDLTYKPKFELVKLEEAPQVAERHFLDLRKRYGSVLAVDLVNKHGGEGRLSEKFAGAMQHIVGDDVRYVHFDFHQICGHIHFELLSLLYDQIEDFLKKNGCLLLNERGEKVVEQVGVVRTNCIDCLDRTNVTQSMIARRMMETQLRRLGIFDPEETISAHPNLDEHFKILWANHGDDISIQYSGTPALKGDFVRCGQRTVQGIIKDGWNALARYYLNNFCDGTKQDAIDLLQGHFIVSVSRDMKPPSQKGGLEAIASFPVAMSLVLTGFLFTVMSLRQDIFFDMESLSNLVSKKLIFTLLYTFRAVGSDVRHLFFSFLWAGLSLAIAAFVKANGRIFCNRPCLNKPRC